MLKMQVISGGWQTLAADAKVIREAVFIQEQHIAAEDEWDALDEVSLHFVMYQEAQAVATARLLENNSVGRVAVLLDQRGLGLGKALMLHIIQTAQNQGRTFLKLSSQVHAMSFYQSLGFIVEGEAYLDCGIPHRDMRLVFA